MKLLENKKIRLTYEVRNTYTAGIELLGGEVKTLRSKLGSLEGARAIIRGGEAYIVGMYIPPYQPENTPKDYDEHRTRRLLLTKAEIAKLAGMEHEHLTLVPLSVFLAHNRLKVDIAVCKKLNKSDKREKIKEKDHRNIVD